MFDNSRSHDSYDTDLRLRKNLRGFDRNSLKILHPLFRDALRLLAHRHNGGKRETLLLPLVRLAPCDRGSEPATPFPFSSIKPAPTAHAPH